MNRKSAKKNFFSKPLVLVVLAIALIASTVGISYAFLTASGSVTNTFDPAHVSVEIHEDLEGTNGSLTAKKAVKFENTSDIPVWIRATAVYSWVDDAGNTVAVPVTSADYSVAIDSAKWKSGNGGFDYYDQEVAVGETITYITDCVVESDSANGKLYKLNVEILVEAIQAADTGAKADAWE